jgi:hypothetical protein
MTTSRTGFLSEILAGGKLSDATLGYFRERLRNRIHQFILRQFQHGQQRGLTQADVARVLGRRPEQINRWLGTPGNWTLDTISDLMLAISKAELEFSEYPLQGRGVRNYSGPDWITLAHDVAGPSPSIRSEIVSAPGRAQQLQQPPQPPLGATPAAQELSGVILTNG